MCVVSVVALLYVLAGVHLCIVGCSLRACVQLCLGVRGHVAYGVAGIDCGMLAIVAGWSACDMWQGVSNLKHGNNALGGILVHWRRVASSFGHRARWRRSRLHLRVSS